MSDSVRPHRQQPTRLPRPWDSPGKNTGVGCHFLLQCMKVKIVSEVSQSCPTLRDPMGYSLPGSSVHGIFQARVLEWGAIAFSDQTVNFSKQEKPLSWWLPENLHIFISLLYKLSSGSWISVVYKQYDEVQFFTSNGFVFKERKAWIQIFQRCFLRSLVIWNSFIKHLMNRSITFFQADEMLVLEG